MVQAQVFLLSGLGRQRCGQPPLLELQALVVPAASEMEAEVMKVSDADQRNLKNINCKFYLNLHTISGMYFESTQAGHAAPHHHHVGTIFFVHPLNDFIVQICVVQVVLVDC